MSSLEHPMDAAEEAAFFDHLARIEGSRAARRHRLELEAELAALEAQADRPALLRRQAD
jgi:hypothetical protein